MTAYDFVKSCGACHPGGGAMEADRDGKRYDERMAAEKGLADSLDGDYHKARWDKSGVVEIDCLLCHANFPYNNNERRAQLSGENYAFAATAAAGFAIVKGKVSEATAVTVAYSPRLFDSQGYVTLDIGMPTDASCLQCHHQPKLKDGEGWQHDHWRDVHAAQGMACIDCHASEGDHNFELGRALHYSAAASEREPMGCRRCHDRNVKGDEGQGLTPDPARCDRHEEKRLEEDGTAARSRYWIRGDLVSKTEFELKYK